MPLRELQQIPGVGPLESGATTSVSRPITLLSTMTTISRRRFLATAALSLAATWRQARRGAGAQVTLELSTEAIGPHMPADFVGLSYEVQQLADPSFFAASNIGLIRQFKALAPRGVLRLGGNTSEFAWWKAGARFS